MKPAMAGRDGIVFRENYFRDPMLWAGLVDLLQDTFSIDVGLQDQMGGPDPSSMPFGYFDDAGRCVANFSGFAMPLVIGGRKVRAAGFQSGAVRPEWRGRGLYRDLLRRAFDWSDAQGFELGLLLTDKPALYEPYGFRTVPQHHFTGSAPAATADTVATAPLALPRDFKMLRRLLDQRQPVSQTFAVCRQAEMFLLNSCLDPNIQLTHFLAENAVVAWQLDGPCLRLLDVVAAKIPPLASIVTGLGISVGRVEVCFPDDLLDWTGTAEPYQSHTQLMVRGDAMNGLVGPFMLSPMAEF